MKRTVKLMASILVTLLFSLWAFRETEWADVMASLRAANYLYLLPYLGVLGLVHVLRTLRWGCLLSGLERVPFRRLNEASGIGFMMLLVLPFRLGEFARPFLIAQRSSIRRSAAMTSVVLERITDGLIVAVLLRVLLFYVPDTSPGIAYVKLASTGMFVLFGGGLAFLLFSLRHQARAVALVRATVGRYVPALADKVADVVDTFVGAMRQLPGPLQLTGFFVYTALYWGLNGAGMVVLSWAFDCSNAAGAACQPLSLSLFQAYVVMCALVVGVMIPAAPGMAGTFQAAVKVGLALFLPEALVKGSGMAYANVLWLCQTLQQVLYGMLLMSQGQLSFRDLASRLDNEGAAPAPLAEARSTAPR